MTTEPISPLSDRTRPISAALFQRHRRPGFFSIEAVFDTVIAAFPDWVETRIKVSPFPSRGVWSRIRSIRAASRAMRDTRAQVAHVLGDEHYLVFGLPRRRTILTVHDCDFLSGKRGLRRFVLWLIWIYLPVRRCAVVTTISERSKAELVTLSGCDPDHVRVIENPLPTRFSPLPETVADRPRILQIGTKPNKNLPRLIRALSGLDVELTVIGRLSDDLKAQISAAGISLENRVDLSDEELVQAYAECSLVAFVSTSEGFGMPIIEAQAIGRPVLTSDIVPMSDVAGGAALLVDPLDADAIRAGIVRLLEDPGLRRDLVQAGHKNVTRFEAGGIARRYADLYAELSGSPA